jgi:hypothetical protein
MAGVTAGASHSYDRPLQAENWPAHPDGPLMVTAHDRDIALQPDFLDRFFQSLPSEYKTLSMNQYVAFLHTRIESMAGGEWQLAFHFDEPYCDYLRDHASSWQLWLADTLQDELKSAREVNLSVDEKRPARLKGTEVLRQPVRIEIPAGGRRHVWRLILAR